jgi:hypothetical protein
MPDRDNLLLLGKALKVSPSWLLFGDEAASGSGFRVEKALPVEAASSLKEKHTKGGLSTRKDRRGETICQVRRKPLARALPRSSRTARGTRRRDAA